MLALLPFEVSCKISFFLDITEILACSQTCRAWYHLCKQLLHQLEPQTTQQLKSVLYAVQNNYIDAWQVKSLKTKAKVPDFALKDLPGVFPSLKTLEFNAPSRCEEERKLDEQQLFAPWRHCLESLTLHESSSMMMLEMCSFSRLVYLKMNFMNNCTPDTSSLKHAPLLKTFILQGAFLSIDAINEIHYHLPFLEKLEFAYQSSTSYTHDVAIPASRLTHLKIKFKGTFQNQEYLLQYIIDKYPSLESLYLLHEFESDPMVMSAMIEVYAPLIEDDVLYFISCLPRTLTTFVNQLTHATVKMVDLLADTGVKAFYFSYDRESDHHDIALPLYCIRGRLDAVWMNVYHIEDLYLDWFTSNLTRLDISCQHIYYNRPEKTIQLDHLFKDHPKLEECKISVNECHVDIKGDATGCKPNVRELVISANSLSCKAMAFIKDTMPGLKRLALLINEGRILKEDTHCSSEDGTNGNMVNKRNDGFRQAVYLPDHSLKVMEMKTPDSINNIVCSVDSVFGDDKRKVYKYLKKEAKVKYCGILDGMEEDCAYIDIQCKNLWHLKVNNVNIF
jgi:uncharacterized pyridoxamine 5'-phosphate oxidase family protein